MGNFVEIAIWILSGLSIIFGLGFLIHGTLAEINYKGSKQYLLDSMTNRKLSWKIIIIRGIKLIVAGILLVVFNVLFF